MHYRLKTACSLTLLPALLVASAWAADPKPDAKADARAEATESAAAMERAKRQAANPLRVILEASKVRRKVGGEAEPAAPEPVADTPALRRVATRSLALPEPRAAAPVAATPLSQSATPAVAPVATAAVAAVDRADEPAPATTLAPTPAPAPQPPLLTLTGGAMSAATTRPPVEGLQTRGLTREQAPALPNGALPQLSPMPPAQPPVSAAPAAAPVRIQQPKLLQMIEPEIPPRVQLDVGRIGEVSVDLSIRPDGTVSGVQVLPPVPRQVVRYIVAAMERWRFEPMAAGTVHRVQLVFDEPGR